MTESDWLTSTDPGAMLAQFVPPGGRSSGLGVELQSFPISNRKLRLFAVACCRQVWPLLADNARCAHCLGSGKLGMSLFGEDCGRCGGTGRVNRSRRAVEAGERYADGEVTETELSRSSCGYNGAPATAQEWARAAAGCLCYVQPEAFLQAAAYSQQAGLSPAAQAALLREIVGNPWRPVRLPILSCSKFVLDNCLALAQAAYSERRDDGALDPGMLAVLADALEEAGCTDRAVLMHLRGQERNPKCAALAPDDLNHGGCWIALRAPHVRGCWAVDAVRGKEAVG